MRRPRALAELLRDARARRGARRGAAARARRSRPRRHRHRAARGARGWSCRPRAAASSTSVPLCFTASTTEGRRGSMGNGESIAQLRRAGGARAARGRRVAGASRSGGTPSAADGRFGRGACTVPRALDAAGRGRSGISGRARGARSAAAGRAAPVLLPRRPRPDGDGERVPSGSSPAAFPPAGATPVVAGGTTLSAARATGLTVRRSEAGSRVASVSGGVPAAASALSSGGLAA